MESQHVSFKAGRKGSYYLEGQNGKGGGLCHNPSEISDTLSPCPVPALSWHPPLSSPNFHIRTHTGLHWSSSPVAVLPWTGCVQRQEVSSHRQGPSQFDMGSRIPLPHIWRWQLSHHKALVSLFSLGLASPGPTKLTGTGIQSPTL